MMIKYITCDGITEVTEPIIEAEFYEHKIHGKKRNQLYCVRHESSRFYNHTPKHPGDNSFTVDFDRVKYIRA